MNSNDILILPREKIADPSILRGNLVVVIDILAATSNLAMLPIAEMKSLSLLKRLQIAAYKKELPESLIIGDIRSDVPNEGIDFTNSPYYFLLHNIVEKVKGKDVGYCSNNGTEVILFALSAGALSVVTASLCNMSAVKKYILRSERKTILLPSQEFQLAGRSKDEDTVFAQAFRDELSGKRVDWEQIKTEIDQILEQDYLPLYEKHRAAGHAKEDREAVLRIDISKNVPEGYVDAGSMYPRVRDAGLSG